jgi:hypothetical protein
MALARLLARVYYDPDTGFGSIAETLRQARQEEPNVTREQVKDFLDKQAGRQVRRAKLRSSFVAQGPRMEFQVDLADFSAFGPSSKRYALVAVDAFSKALAVVPLRSKTAVAAAAALDVVVARLGVPKVAMADSGAEFLGAFARRCEYYDAKHIAVRFYAPFVERAIRPIKEGILSRQRASPRPWDSYIDQVVIKYNGTERAGTRMTPREAAKDSNAEVVHARLEKQARIVSQPPLKQGDFVKILQKPRGPQDLKVNFSRWSDTVHAVDGVEPGPNGVSFYRVGGKKYLRAELLRVQDAQRPLGGKLRGGLPIPVFEPLRRLQPIAPEPPLQRLRRLVRVQNAA